MCMNTASNKPTQYDEMVISMPQCICNSITPTIIISVSVIPYSFTVQQTM